MSIKVTVKNLDKVQAKIRRVLKNAQETVRSIDGKRVVIGIPESAHYPNGQSVRSVAALVEYGTTRMPPRPFMRSCRADNKAKWWNQMRREIRQVAKGKETADAALISVGETMKADIRQAITDYDAIDTGRLRDSFEVKVV